MKRWGGDVLLEFTELPTVPCKDITSFGKDGEEEKQLFNPLSPDSIEQFNIYGPKLLCLKNTDDLRIKGNYDSSRAAQLMVIFEKCNPQARAKKGLRCKTDAEIDQWLEFKYLFVLENGRQFVQHKFGPARIDESAKHSWYPISSKTRADVVRMIKRNDMALYDHAINFAEVRLDSA